MAPLKPSRSDTDSASAADSATRTSVPVRTDSTLATATEPDWRWIRLPLADVVLFGGVGIVVFLFVFAVLVWAHG